jgi:F-type H+-transporting ATPase subunit delta
MAQDIEKDVATADVYAAALFTLATESGAADAVRDELAQLVQFTGQSPEFSAFISSLAINDDAREASLERMFRGRLSDLLLNTLQIMNQHNRLALLPPLLRAFDLRQEQARGEVEVVATSAVELDPTQRAEVARVATALSGKKPLVAYQVDPSVIGGLVLQIGGLRFDNSIRRHLWTAQNRLLEQTTRAEVNG